MRCEMTTTLHVATQCILRPPQGKEAGPPSCTEGVHVQVLDDPSPHTVSSPTHDWARPHFRPDIFVMTNSTFGMSVVS